MRNVFVGKRRCKNKTEYIFNKNTLPLNVNQVRDMWITEAFKLDGKSKTLQWAFI